MRVDYLPTQQAADAARTSNNAGTALGMDDFFKLLVAQLSNQDMFNTVDDTEFISQMAQFSMVQALNDLSRASLTSYSMSLIGKEATIALPSDDGTAHTVTGIVDSVLLYGGSPQLVIDGQRYDLDSVVQVQSPNIIVPGSNIVPGSEDRHVE